MLPSPADSGEDRPGGLDRPASDSGMMAAPVADAFAIAPQVPAQLSVRSGGCFARPLPLDGSCAGAARRFFREAVAGMGMPGDLIHDGVTMASELAANTMHAQGNVEFGSNRLRPVTGFPELSDLSPRHRCQVRTGLQGLRLAARLADGRPLHGRASGPHQACPGGRQRPRAAGCQRAVRWAMGLSPDSGPAGQLEGSRQGRMVLAAAAAGL